MRSLALTHTLWLSCWVLFVFMLYLRGGFDTALAAALLTLLAGILSIFSFFFFPFFFFFLLFCVILNYRKLHVFTKQIKRCKQKKKKVNLRGGKGQFRIVFFFFFLLLTPSIIFFRAIFLR